MKNITQILGQRDQLKSIGKRLRDQQDLLVLIRSLLPSPLADHCIWAVERKGVLMIFVDSPAWASRLRYSGARLQQQLHHQGVKARRIQVKVLLINEGEAKVRMKPRQARTLSPANARLLQSTAQSVSDKKLGAALERLSRHVKP